MKSKLKFLIKKCFKNMDMVLVKKYGDIAEADLAKNILAEYKIKSIVQKGGLVYPTNNSDLMATSLFVLASDLEKAKDILG